MRKLASWLSADRLAALLFLALFGAYALVGGTIRSALSVDVIGPGFFPRLVGLLGIGLALAMLLRSPGPEAGGARLTRPDAVSLAPAGFLLLYVLSLPWIGFILATPVFLAVTFRYFGCPGWVRSALFAVVATAAAVALFSYGLDVTLPTGRLQRL